VRSDISQLENRRRDKRGEMQRIKARKPQHEELIRGYPSLADRSAIFPEKYETGYHPEDRNSKVSIVVEKTEEPIERKFFDLICW
jgi:hypothetical protein